ncbi:MAG: hypothetical protein Q8R49_04910 [Rhodoferax sp.]|nr:hypothetical protein [Rhodoferax sp.]
MATLARPSEDEMQPAVRKLRNALIMIAAYIFMGVLEAIRTWVLVRVEARLDGAPNTRVFNALF